MFNNLAEIIYRANILDNIPENVNIFLGMFMEFYAIP
jgi:hypothetical protein